MVAWQANASEIMIARGEWPGRGVICWSTRVFDQLSKNSGAGAEMERSAIWPRAMVKIGLAHDKIWSALQQRQERNQEKEQHGTETAESKFQR